MAGLKAKTPAGAMRVAVQSLRSKQAECYAEGGRIRTEIREMIDKELGRCKTSRESSLRTAAAEDAVENAIFGIEYPQIKSSVDAENYRRAREIADRIVGIGGGQ